MTQLQRSESEHWQVALINCCND